MSVRTPSPLHNSSHFVWAGAPVASTQPGPLGASGSSKRDSFEGHKLQPLRKGRAVHFPPSWQSTFLEAMLSSKLIMDGNCEAPVALIPLPLRA